ncbi:putative Ig domain-containing protein, partial [Shewanella sp. AS1]|uniref:putative Ig domain-containing protein n=1 Tax=Shewanella sp. AS1 TaxID=2907626 RepID=UPI001F174668
TDQGSAFSFGVPAGTFADIDSGDTLTLSASTPAWLSFDATTGIFSGTPANSDVGTAAITVTATDSQGATVTSTFNLVVNNVNDAPVLDPIAQVSAKEDGSVVNGTITSTDIDANDTATYS